MDVVDAYIRFLAPVVPQTATMLLRAVDDKMRRGYRNLHLMLSTPGGSVFHGLSIHNWLKGLPMDVYTYNFGSVDSIGVVLFCAGKRRYCVPHARFLIHGVSLNVNANTQLDEKGLEERLKSLKIDYQNIARVIAATTGKPAADIEAAMNARTTLNPDEAKMYGLVHEIKSDLLPPAADLTTIGEDGMTHSVPPEQLNLPMAMHTTMPENQGFTRSRDLDIGTWFGF